MKFMTFAVLAVTNSALNPDEKPWEKKGLRTLDQAKKFLLPVLVAKDGANVRRRENEVGALVQVTGTITSEVVELEPEAKDKLGYVPVPDKFKKQSWTYCAEKVKDSNPPVFTLKEVVVKELTQAEIEAANKSEVERLEGALAKAKAALK